MSKFFALIAALSAVAILAAGCGSSDDSTTDSTAALTKAEFVKQGNAICKAGNEEVNSEFEKFAEEHNIGENKPPTDAQLEEAAEDFLIPSTGRQVEEVGDLGAPEGEEEAFDKFIANAEGRVEEVEADPGLMVSEDEDPFESVKEEAAALGLTACGEEEEG